jgi:putative hydrolase of the HAD superfamily
VQFIDKFKVLLFDMNGTFMFGHDRFGETEDFYSTYRSIGGCRLTPEAVRSSVMATCTGLIRDYQNPDLVESFPVLSEGVRRYGKVLEENVPEIEAVIASHEVGCVPPWASETLCRLSETHKFAIVSNVWAAASHWTDELSRSDVANVCSGLIFSSDIGSIKPSPRPFLAALHLLSARPQEALFVGDSVERDIRPAKALGMGTAWVASSGTEVAADIRIASIADLESIYA